MEAKSTTTASKAHFWSVMQKFAMWWHMYRSPAETAWTEAWSLRPPLVPTSSTSIYGHVSLVRWSEVLLPVVKEAEWTPKRFGHFRVCSNVVSRHPKATCSWHFVPRFPLRPRRDTRHSLRRRTCPGQRWGPDLRASFRMLMGQLLTAVFLSDLYQFVNVERLYDACMYGYV